MRHWRRYGSHCRHQGNGRRNASGNSPSRPHHNGHHSTSQGNVTGAMRAPSASASQAPPSARDQSPTAALDIRYDPT